MGPNNEGTPVDAIVERMLRLMDEAIGPHFAIVGEVGLLADRRPDAVRLPGVGADWLAQRHLRAALLRPDRYIAEIA